MSLTNALAAIPGYGAYVAKRQMNEAQPMEELKQVSAVLGLQQALQKQEQEKAALARQAAFRNELTKLGPNATQDHLAQVAARYTDDPAKLLTVQQQSLDRQAAAEARAQANRDRLEQMMRFNDLTHEFRMSRAQTDADRIAETARHNKEMERLRGLMGQAVSPTEILDPEDKTRLLKVDARTYKGGSLGAPGVIGIAGKEPGAAKKAEQVDQGRDTVSSLITTLRDQYRQLDNDGGITNPDKGFLPNLQAGIASSGPGQFAGRMIGTQNQSIRNQIAQQRPLLLQAIKQATGMSAKQMDSNAELKLYLSAATDPTLDIRANLAALEKLDELYGLSGQKKPSAPAPDNGAPGLPAQSDIDAEIARRRAARGGR